MSSTSWSSSITSFLSSSFGTEFEGILTFLAILFIIGGVAHAIFKNHANIGKMVRRIIEVIVVGVVFATPQIWTNIVPPLAGAVQNFFSLLGSHL